MKKKSTFISLCFGILSAVSLAAHSEIVFQDSFESGDMYATNSVGFEWWGSMSTSVVNSTHETYTNVTPTNTLKSAAEDFPGGDWTAKDGTHSLRFRYPKGAHMSEQRFSFGIPRKEIWIRYWIRVPVNYAHGPTNDPNKFFSLWMDDYSHKGDGSTVWLSMWRGTNGNSKLGFTYSLGGYRASEGFKQVVPFIKTTDAGRWMQIALHIKAETSPGASDGVFQTFRRWEDEGKFTKLHETKTAPLKIPSDGTPNGFKSGYLLGYANAAYTEDTEWLLDDFTVADTPLIVTPKAATALLVE